ncbi:MAG: glycosyltransferase [Bacteroidales bacterium]|nr:glycosyltransferase [Bacteroidales bacterium]MDD3812682.1 glycosyltransferase [Bacteroidales bacterium]MDD4811661.1 glycosyltransferase [Bacteroidales bacterium]
MDQIIQTLFEIPLTVWSDYIFLALACLTLLSWAVQMFFYLRYYRQVGRYKKTNIKSDQDSVSVILCVKNEAINLAANLPIILNQNYPDFQVVVVNEGSEDETADLLTQFQKEHPHLYVTHIERNHPYPHARKLAQTIGVKAAKHEQLLFTEASCRPQGLDWITHMQSNFLMKNDIVIGYCTYHREKSALNRFIRTDNLMDAQQYLGFALKGNPFKANGRNLAFRKSLFIKRKGYASQLHLPSGENDVFVNQSATSLNTSIEIHPDSILMAEAPRTLKEWLRRKQEDLAAVSHFRRRQRLMIRFESISRVVYYFCLILLLSWWRFAGYLIILAFIRLLTRLWITKLTIKRLKEKGVWLLSLIHEIIIPWIHAVLILKNRLRKGNKFSW